MSTILDRLHKSLSDRYRFEREIGHGGMATVFLAQDLKHGRPVAVKVLNPEISSSLGSDRFLREIEIAARLTHPHILPLHDSGSADGLLYYVMPYIEGETLRQRIDREKQLPLESAFQIAREVADALDFAHKQGVVHRDIKPENIMIVGGHATVADFGIARAVSSSGQEMQTATGVAVGTAAYMSPEQASGSETIDGRSDIYALGCVLYEMLAGAPIFSGPTTESVVRQHMSAPPPPVRNLRPAVSDAVALILEKALAKTPADRFETAAEFASALKMSETSMTGTSMTAAQPLAAPQSKGRMAAILSGVAALLVLVAAIGYFVRGGGPGDGAGGAGDSGRKMIVVLPFENLGDPDDAYFADGITEEITSHLASIEGLGVIARTSAIQYKDSPKPIDEIGKELGVDYVLEGTIRWQKVADGDSRIRVTPQLIRVSDATHLWTDRYDAVLADVFDVQSEIAQKVTGAMDLALGETGTGSEEAPTENMAAYELYLQGVAYYLGEPSSESYDEAIDRLEKSLAEDPNFVDAKAFLALANIERYWTDRNPLSENRETADRLIKELERDHPDLDKLPLLKGYYYYHGFLDYQRAIPELERAVQLRPNDSEAKLGLAAAHRRSGNWERAAEIFKQAVELNPRDPVLASETATTLMFQGDLEGAKRYNGRALSILPKSANYLITRATLEYYITGDRADADRLLEEAVTTAGRAACFGAIDNGTAALFSKEDLRAFTELSASQAGMDISNYYQQLANMHGILGDKSKQQAYAESVIVILEPMIEQAPNFFGFHARIAGAYSDLGMHEKALEHALRSTELLPVSQDALVGTFMKGGVADVYINMGDLDKAIDVIEEILPLYPVFFRRALELDVHPDWEPLRQHPRAQQLIKPSI